MDSDPDPDPRPEHPCTLPPTDSNYDLCNNANDINEQVSVDDFNSYPISYNNDSDSYYDEVSV